MRVLLCLIPTLFVRNLPSPASASCVVCLFSQTPCQRPSRSQTQAFTRSWPKTGTYIDLFSRCDCTTIDLDFNNPLGLGLGNSCKRPHRPQPQAQHCVPSSPVCRSRSTTTNRSSRSSDIPQKAKPEELGIHTDTISITSCNSRTASNMNGVNGPSKPSWARLLGVEGDGGKTNDIVFCGKTSKAESNVIFFGGDVQDFSENMLAHQDNKNYEQWNLEATAQVLQERFFDSHIWVVRPSQMHRNTFSRFANFVESNDYGCPSHAPGQKSWHHLLKLLQNGAAKVSRGIETQPSGEKVAFTPSLDLPVELVGFSKGCVVLNQLVYDVEEAKQDKLTMALVKNVKRIHWLDGGHNGPTNTWITDELVLQKVQDLELRVAVHVTPYQVKDPARLRIGKEQKVFVDRLRRTGIDVMNTLHFANRERSLDIHFNVLKKF